MHFLSRLTFIYLACRVILELIRIVIILDYCLARLTLDFQCESKGLIVDDDFKRDKHEGLKLLVGGSALCDLLINADLDAFISDINM